ncbi:Na+/Pi symporter [Podila horticola]|nr:Na+/Pi symporter [Podila horticola]
MVCALSGSASWVPFTVFQGSPVSTTHAIVGAITGAGISAFKRNGVQWDGITKIVLSSVISSVASGDHHDSFCRGLIVILCYFGVALTIQVYYIIFKGAPKSDLKSASFGIPMGIAVIVGIAAFLWCFFFLRPYLRRKIQNDEDLRWYHVFYFLMVSQRVKPALHQEEITKKDDALRRIVVDGQADSSLAQLDEEDKSFTQRMKAEFLGAFNHDINETQNEDTLAAHEHPTKFDPLTERLFSAVQVVTACFTSFAHGPNDVANAIGPLATIYYIWLHASVDMKKTLVPVWIQVLGSVAIHVELMTYGCHVMKTLGNKITYMSPARGFSAGMATSIIILTCSKLKLLVSSTHCVTGSTASIGLLSGGGFNSLNYKALLILFGGWVIILPATGLISGLVYAFVAVSPYKPTFFR